MFSKKRDTYKSLPDNMNTSCNALCFVHALHQARSLPGPFFLIKRLRAGTKCQPCVPWARRGLGAALGGGMSDKARRCCFRIMDKESPCGSESDGKWMRVCQVWTQRGWMIWGDCFANSRPLIIIYATLITFLSEQSRLRLELFHDVKAMSGTHMSSVTM